MNADLRDRLFANDRLLKALIVLLAHRDPDLLQELDAIFSRTALTDTELQDISAGSRNEVRRELQLIRSLAFDGEEQPGEVPANRNES